MRSTDTFVRSTLDTGTIKKLIDAAADRGFQVISFTGGEPMLDFNRLVELIRYAGNAGIPFIRTGTNGFLFKNSKIKDYEDRVAGMVDRLADTTLRNFWISLDSCIDEVHEQMRGFSGVVDGIGKALPVFHRAGIYPAANLGINRNVGGKATRDLRRENFTSESAYLETFYEVYSNSFELFYKRVIDLGFTMVNACYPMSIDTPECNQGLNAVYAASTIDDIVRFNPLEKQMLFKALKSAIRKFRSKIRIFSPLCSLEAMIRQYNSENSTNPTYGCRGGVDFFFVNAADGHIYPCGYRGNEDFGWLWDLEISSRVVQTEANGCRQCDWECFRDPSELFGPLLESFSNPPGLVRRMAATPEAFTTWAQDLRYYQACGFFNGRMPPDYRKLKRF
jgi:MoaA/NifB/PqqE/SkfB family radical SAM enzyme